MINDAKVLSMSVEAKKFAMPRWLMLSTALLVTLLLPQLFGSNYFLSMMSRMGIAILAALAYNILLGQSGLLSFGPAVYSGLGGYATIHLLNLAAGGKLPIPVTLLPLVGGITGLIFAALFGYVTTKRAGTVFSMITMGVAELVGAASLVLPGFGGEGGVSGNRNTGAGWFGIDYGSSMQIFYLIAGWAIVCSALMYGLTRTPLGRMANAVRDNSERVQFVGYNPQRIRYMMFIIAGFFAGIAGGLAALNYEIVTHEYLGHQASSGPLLMAYIGGCGYFFGPILGAILITFLEVVIGGYTKAWPLYMGAIFIATVLFAPQGLAGIVMQHRQAWQNRLMRRLVPVYLKAVGPLVLLSLGLVSMIEYIYHLTTNTGSVMRLFGISLDAATPMPWLAALTLAAVGFWLLRRARTGITLVWDDITSQLQGGHAR